MIARVIAYRQLAARDRTRAELAHTLAKRGVPLEASEIALSELAERGYLDDARVVESAVANVTRRPRSRSALERELVQRGVDRDLAREATGSIDRDVELDAARRLAAKRVSGLARLDKATAYRRLAAALARRGFGADIVSTVAKDVLAQYGVDDEGSGTFDSWAD